MNTLLRTLAFALPVSIASFTLGCGSSSNSPTSESDASTKGDTGGGSDAIAKSDTGGGSDASGSTPTFTDVYTGVIATNGCTACHNPTVGAGNLDMSTQAAAFTDLVGVPAAGPACAGMGTRVVAGNAAMSLLYEKVFEMTPPCGAEMPLAGNPISTDDVATIKDWINGGAKN